MSEMNLVESLRGYDAFRIAGVHADLGLKRVDVVTDQVQYMDAKKALEHLALVEAAAEDVNSVRNEAMREAVVQSRTAENPAYVEVVTRLRGCAAEKDRLSAQIKSIELLVTLLTASPQP